MPIQSSLINQDAKQTTTGGISVPVDAGTSVSVTGKIGVCSNCGATTNGPFCAKCGQHEQSVIRFFGSVVMHLLDDILGFDSRAGRTLFPLIFRPGFLTTEYIRGRRVHYVPPLRLYLFVSIIFFITLDLFTDDSVKELVKIQQGDTQVIDEASKKLARQREKMAVSGYVPQLADHHRLGELLQQRLDARQTLQANINKIQNEMDDMTAAKKQSGDEQASPGQQALKETLVHSLEKMRGRLGGPVEALQLELVENQLQILQLTLTPVARHIDKPGGDEAEATSAEQSAEQSAALAQRQLWLREKLASLPKPVVEADDNKDQAKDKKNDDSLVQIDADGPFQLNWTPPEWLSPEQNQQLQAFVKTMEKKAELAIRQDAAPLIKQIFAVLPQIMFILLPVFALLLKFFYLFSRRYYMEHLTVALHSHAFLFVLLTLLALLSTIHDNVVVSHREVASTLEAIASGLLIWVPFYLFLMQKRVYRQGYFLTLVKFSMVGISYGILMLLTTASAFFWGLAKL